MAQTAVQPWVVVLASLELRGSTRQRTGRWQPGRQRTHSGSCDRASASAPCSQASSAGAISAFSSSSDSSSSSSSSSNSSSSSAAARGGAASRRRRCCCAAAKAGRAGTRGRAACGRPTVAGGPATAGRAAAVTSAATMPKLICKLTSTSAQHACKRRWRPGGGLAGSGWRRSATRAAHELGLAAFLLLPAPQPLQPLCSMPVPLWRPA